MKLSQSIKQRHKRSVLYRCGRKVGFRYRPTALRAMGKLKERTGDTSELDVYHCGKCGGFHVGHPPQLL